MERWHVTLRYRVRVEAARVKVVIKCRPETDVTEYSAWVDVCYPAFV